MRSGLLALLAVFWVAQLHGLAHGISHLSRSAGLDPLSAPHALVCADCIASADSGAAPVLERPAPPPAAIPTNPALPAAVADAAREPTSDYRSRAPPAPI